MSNQVITFGCRLNAYESEAIKSAVDKSNHKDLIVFNSCAVTSQAEKQLKQAIRKAARENPEAKIVVTGCAAQINPVDYAKMEEVSLVIGNEDKSKTESYSLNKVKKISKISNLELGHQDHIFFKENKNEEFFDSGLEEKILVNDIMSVTETASHMVSGFENKSRAFVQVQNGCNHRCTFCIIPYGRGNSRSVALGEIVAQVKKLVDNGYKEVVLTGVDITDYGVDLIGKITFSQMIRRLLRLVPELPRLRVSSIDVAEVDADLLDIVKNESRFMPYFHISLQSGDDMILKRMKRRHNRNQVIEFCKKVKEIRPEAAFGSDIIVGFPTETEEMFINTVNLIKESDIVLNHIFPYSIRKGTPAAKMPQVLPQIRKERAARLRAETAIQLNKFLDTMLGSRQKVIIEDGNIGRCENFITTKIENGINLKSGDIIEVLIDRRIDNQLISQII